MRNWLEFDTAPYDEECVQVESGSVDYIIPMKQQGRKFIELLNKRFGTPPNEAYFGLKANDHDFGVYYSVCIFFNDEDEEETKFAYFVENNVPATWDDSEFKDYRIPKEATL
jgi:hypothetical protein